MDGCTAHLHKFTQVCAQCVRAVNTEKEFNFPQLFLSIAPPLHKFGGAWKTKQ